MTKHVDGRTDSFDECQLYSIPDRMCLRAAPCSVLFAANMYIRSCDTSALCIRQHVHGRHLLQGQRVQCDLQAHSLRQGSPINDVA